MRTKKSPMRESMEQMVTFLENLPKDENGSVTLTPLQQITLISFMDVYAERETLIYFFNEGLSKSKVNNGHDLYLKTFYNE